MGKPDFLAPHSPHAGPTTPLTESASSISLQAHPSRQQYFDEDPTELGADDLPPLYDDLDNQPTSIIDPLVSNDHLAPGAPPPVEPFSRNSQRDVTYYIDHRLESEPKFLQETLKKLAESPPRPFVQIRGTHTETRRKSDDKTEQVQVVDFDIEIEFTFLLYRDIARGPNGAWRHLRSVGNFEKVRRGTVFSTRAPGFGGGSGSGAAETGEPTVEEWCHRFCASRAGLKCLTFERRVTGYDWDYIKIQLERLVRDTNYRGHTSITFPVRNARVEIYNSCRTNRWRLTKWIEVIFVFTLMFLFTWPWLFFRTKRWETIYSEWYLSRQVEDPNHPGDSIRDYPCMSEAQWYNMWARAIQKAVLERRQGQLDQDDVQRAERPSPAQEAGGIAGMIASGVEAMGTVNRSFGWGGDSDRRDGAGGMIGGMMRR